jgi:hypothetical protein
VLLSTGYIAGGAIGGVLIAFLSFSNEIPRYLSTWQYRQYTVTQERPLEEAYREAAAYDLGLREAELPERDRRSLKKRADEIKELNANDLYQYVRVPQGTVLKLPKGQTLNVPADRSLGELAKEMLGRSLRAPLLYDLNVEKLKMPETLPAGARLRLPQREWPALLAFSALALVLVMVGIGRWMLPGR